MKNTVFHCVMAVSSLLCVGLSNEASAECSDQHFLKIDSEKCYLMPGSLSMDKKGLYVNFDGILYPISNVSVDEHGVFVPTNELADYGIIAYCPDGHPNPPWRLVCKVCGKNLY